MPWFRRHRRVSRLSLLLGVIVAMLGPWTATSDGMPPPERCEPPLVVSEHGRCVKLVSGASVFAFIATAWGQFSLDLLAGRATVAQRGGEYLTVSLLALGLLLLLLPVVSTLLAVVGLRRRSVQKLPTVAWGVSGLVAALLGGFLGNPGRYLLTWGAWLFVGLAAIGLGSEWQARPRRAGTA